MYDARKASSVYASMAGVLSGFAFTAIVILVTTPNGAFAVLANLTIPTPRASVGISLGTMAAYLLAPLFLLLAIRELEHEHLYHPQLARNSKLSFGISYSLLFFAVVFWAISDSYLEQWRPGVFYAAFLIISLPR